MSGNRSRPLLLGLALFLLPPAEAAKSDWKTISSGDLANSKPRLEAEAAAEILLWKIEVDDYNFPQKRTTTEYIRYKIFDPRRVENITRISGVGFSWSQNRTELYARLTLPGGKSQEFGRESLKERSLAKAGKEGGFLGWLANSSAEITEQFLAIPGVEPGAVLEYQIVHQEEFPSAVHVFVGQREGLPIRRLDYSVRSSRYDERFNHRLFLFNQQSAQMTEDLPAKRVTITATDLPAMTIEPFMGPATDYALTVVRGHDAPNLALTERSGKVPVPGIVDAKHGPWAFYATLVNWFERDHGWATKRVQQLATQITTGAANDAEKARLIHVHVRTAFQLWLKRPPLPIPPTKAPNSLDDVIDWEKARDAIVTPDDFLWLAIALNKSAGLDAHTVLLPNRQLSRFYRENVSPLFLPYMAVAVRLGENWAFSSPHHQFELPFGLLPWSQEGQVGLLALDRKEEFIPVAAAGPAKTVAATLGQLEITADGTLTGECRRIYTGHSAAQIRAQLKPAGAQDREKVAQGLFGLDLKVVEIAGLKIIGVDDTDKPLQLSATLRWPGFALLTKDRLILRISPFRAEAASLFAATERKSPVHFPYRWQEIDRISIQVPADYAPESPSSPAPMPGETLSFRTQVRYEQGKNTLHVLREFSSNLADVPPTAYPRLREWHAQRTRADQHEIVFTKRPVSVQSARSQPEK